jgi:hypothetical protein
MISQRKNTQVNEPCSHSLFVVPLLTTFDLRRLRPRQLNPERAFHGDNAFYADFSFHNSTSFLVTTNPMPGLSSEASPHPGDWKVENNLTQESIASILGVRRESVTAIARKLQEAGTICYRRGHIMVIDQASFQKETCECYKKIKKEFDQVFDEVKTCEKVRQNSIDAVNTL